ncbi:MAG TPA: hypothetical protein VE978_03655 [Chitinophagales bacterium]|nr:hypothetical protein [Chitinophagales bacterium]
MNHTIHETTKSNGSCVKIFISILLLFGIYSCHQNGSSKNYEDEEYLEIEKIISGMDVVLTPQDLVFDENDSIPIVIDCTFKNSALDCGSGEVRFVIDDTINMSRVYEDSTYNYQYCACGDTVFLNHLSSGIHILSGSFSWNKGDWTLGKNWKRQIIIN